MIVEVCANSLESALAALNAGANRIELCSELSVGGVTPSYGLLKKVRDALDIPIHVLIRPRSGHFTYTEAEFSIMKENIKLCWDLGIDGIVSGVLLPDLSLDIKRTQELMSVANGMTFTFHRAFDWVPDPLKTFELLQDMGVDWVLTSGQESKATEGIKLLMDLQKRSDHCMVLPGGGISLDNVSLFKEKEFKAVHLSASSKIAMLEEMPSLPMSAKNTLDDQFITQSNKSLLQKVVAVVS